MNGTSPELPQGVLRRAPRILVTSTLAGTLLGSLVAAVDWRRILLNGDFIEVSILNRLWLTVTAAGATAGLILGALFLLALVIFTRGGSRRFPALPGGFRVAALLTVAVLLVYLGLRVATPAYEGRLPRLRLDRQCPQPAGPGSDPAGSTESVPASVILIVLDTVRADHLSVHGYRHPTTPVLEELAEESMVCDSARSTASWTLPAHGSLFTGLYPSQHRLHCYHHDQRPKGQRLLITYPMDAAVQTLPELLRLAGFQTTAIFANPILSPSIHLDRGFEFYLRQHNYNSRLPLISEPLLKAAPWSGWLTTFRKGTPTARQISRRVTHWLDHHARPPFFLFVNYMDAHWPYSPPPPFDTIFPGKQETTLSHFDLRRIVLGRQRPLTAAELAGIQSQYDGEIRYLDSQLGELFDHLRQRGLYDSSLIIVTSDHGEYFGEHQLVFHGRDLYEGGVKIPLLVKYPGGTPRGRLTDPVGLEDVFPTVLETLGLPLPPTLSGVPLGAPRSGPTVAENYYSFKFDLKNTDYGSRFNRVRRSMVLGRQKFIHSSDGKHELYDLQDDPGETRNLLAGSPELAEPFLEYAATLEKAANRPRAEEDPPDLRSRNPERDRELREQLEELGYLEPETP